ncbi:NADPH:quinone reductase [Salinispirillum marinum]|uniref:NADPH:quinone reductase n=2 Tax=Saccharospirillaceae TaxID=255527 RepID=A0ABV8BFU1_9GAMM
MLKKQKVNLMKAMRSHEHGDVDVLNLETVDQPTPNDDQLLIAVKAAGVNPVDTYIRAGINNYSAKFPHTPGMDGAGEVAAVGKNVVGFAVGDRVYFNRNLTGSAAEFALCEPSNCFPLADAVSFAEGAGIGVPYTTAHRALFGRAQAKAGEKVLIHGATGAVGIACVQLAKAAGLTVVASAGTDEGAKLLEKQGADMIIRHDAEGHLDSYSSFDSGFNIIIEMLANVNLDIDLKALARQGRVVVVGNRGTVEINPRDLMARDAQVMGMAVMNMTPADHQQTAKAMYPLFAAGLLKPVVRKEYALTELPQAHLDVLKPGALGNLVITVG